MRNILITATTLAAGPALAHVGQGEVSGFAAGLSHSFGGADHLLAMAAVGVWSALALPAPRVWTAPAGFLAAMLVGAGLAFAGVSLPGAEAAIALSVVVLGLMAALRLELGAAAGAAAAGFALFHGWAHGTEAAGAVLPYMAGFALATAVIHLGGIGLGLALARSRAASALLGGGVALAGAAMLAG